jgi:hypothetical protein
VPAPVVALRFFSLRPSSVRNPARSSPVNLVEIGDGGEVVMFVVRIENDEATTYRAFRRAVSARSYAVDANRDDLESLVDIFEASGTTEAADAVAAVRYGRGRLVERAEALPSNLPPFVPEGAGEGALAI